MRAVSLSLLAVWSCAALTPVRAAHAQDQDPAAAAFAALAAEGVVRDTTLAGEAGVLLVTPGEGARAAGLNAGDLILAVDGGRPPAGWRGASPRAASGRTWTVWRRVPGDRPVVKPAILGRRTLDEFAALAPQERTAMRLARMLANSATLVRDGAGVLLVPATPEEDAAWLRVANPMPAASESALAAVSNALLQRVNIPPAPEGEAAAARADLDAQRFVEAEEHARRALLQIVRTPAQRVAGTEFEPALAMYLQAQQRAARERADLLAPEARFAFVGEGGMNWIQAFPAQHTLHEVENSDGWFWAAGLRLGWPGNSPRLLQDFSLLAGYGQSRNTFDGRGGVGGFASTLQQITGEIMYRPRVASRLRPYFRGGVGAFPLSMRVQVPEGYRVAFERTNVGFVAGGGIDVLRVPAAHLRLAAGGTYRVLKYKILKENAPDVELTRNTDLTVVTTVDNNPDLLLFDMDGWQVGLMLTFEP